MSRNDERLMVTANPLKTLMADGPRRTRTLSSTSLSDIQRSPSAEGQPPVPAAYSLPRATEKICFSLSHSNSSDSNGDLKAPSWLALLSPFLPCVPSEEFLPGSVILRPSESPCERLLLVFNGSVEHTSPLVPITLGEMEVFPISSFVNSSPVTSEYRALERTTIKTLGKQALLELLKDPEMALSFCDMVSDQARLNNSRVNQKIVASITSYVTPELPLSLIGPETYALLMHEAKLKSETSPGALTYRKHLCATATPRSNTYAVDLSSSDDSSAVRMPAFLTLCSPALRLDLVLFDTPFHFVFSPSEISTVSLIDPASSKAVFKITLRYVDPDRPTKHKLGSLYLRASDQGAFIYTQYAAAPLQTDLPVTVNRESCIIKFQDPAKKHSSSAAATPNWIFSPTWLPFSILLRKAQMVTIPSGYVLVAPPSSSNKIVPSQNMYSIVSGIVAIDSPHSSAPFPVTVGYVCSPGCIGELSFASRRLPTALARAHTNVTAIQITSSSLKLLAKRPGARSQVSAVLTLIRTNRITELPAASTLSLFKKELDEKKLCPMAMSPFGSLSSSSDSIPGSPPGRLNLSDDSLRLASVFSGSSSTFGPPSPGFSSLSSSPTVRFAASKAHSKSKSRELPVHSSFRESSNALKLPSAEDSSSSSLYESTFNMRYEIIRLLLSPRPECEQILYTHPYLFSVELAEDPNTPSELYVIECLKGIVDSQEFSTEDRLAFFSVLNFWVDIGFIHQSLPTHEQFIRITQALSELVSSLSVPVGFTQATLKVADATEALMRRINLLEYTPLYHHAGDSSVSESSSSSSNDIRISFDDALHLLNSSSMPSPSTPPSASSHFDVDDFEPREVAAILSAIESELFLQLPVAELLLGRFSKPRTSPNIRHLTSHFNLVTQVITSSILNRTTLHSRINLVERWISVAESAFKINNYSLLLQVVSSLGSTSISRLKSTWNAIQPKQFKVYTELSGFINPIENYAAYRKAVVVAYQERKQEELTHPLLETKTPLGLLPLLQARFMARTIRRAMESYVPFLAR